MVTPHPPTERTRDRGIILCDNTLEETRWSWHGPCITNRQHLRHRVGEHPLQEEIMHYSTRNASTEEQNALNDALERATTDRGFRERLLNEPRAALAEVTGQALPQGFVIRFIEKDENTDVLVVLPELVPETVELSDAELQAVAGGADQGSCWVQSCGQQGASDIDIDIDTCDKDPEEPGGSGG